MSGSSSVLHCQGKYRVTQPELGENGEEAARNWVGVETEALWRMIQWVNPALTFARLLWCQALFLFLKHLF